MSDSNGAEQQVAAPRAIAVDGLSGAGKSTVSRRVARRLGWAYLDTGACYRALAVAALRAGAVRPGAAAVADPIGPSGDHPTDVAVVAERALRTLHLATDPDDERVRLGDLDVTREIRSARTTSTVSAVAAVPAVRAAAVRWQRAQVAAAAGCVVEGRDIGTVVLPSAAVKVWLTASPERRAERRAAETATSGAATGAALARRDRLDTGRAADPAQPAPDAVVIDTDGLDVDDVVDRVLELARACGLVPA